VSPANAEEETIRTQPVSAYVIIADIVGYSTVGQDTQVQWVRRFFQILRDALSWSGADNHNIFPTGDGAILALYSNGPPKAESAQIPVNLARHLLELNKDGPFRLRVSINYSESETMFRLGGAPFISDVPMQTGEGIYLAERAIHFAEPNEIIVTEQYWDVLRRKELLGRFSFEILHDVFVKHFRPIKLFIYIPKATEALYLSRPDVVSHPLRRYAYFPPLRPETVDRFAALGLQHELELLCRYTYDSVAVVNTKFTFVSWDKIYNILKLLNARTDEAEQILVLSRSDRHPNFWSTPAAEKYLGHLASTGRNRRFNQTRIFVYKDAEEELASEGVLSSLRELHASGTLYKVDRAYLTGSVLLKYIFGVNVYPKLGCVVAPIPSSSSYDDYWQAVSFSSPHGSFLQYLGTEEDPGNFRAYVTASPEIVAELVNAFDALQRHECLEPV
jgi:hypothetical protein